MWFLLSINCGYDIRISRFKHNQIEKYLQNNEICCQIKSTHLSGRHYWRKQGPFLPLRSFLFSLPSSQIQLQRMGNPFSEAEFSSTFEVFSKTLLLTWKSNLHASLFPWMFFLYVRYIRWNRRNLTQKLSQPLISIGILIEIVRCFHSFMQHKQWINLFHPTEIEINARLFVRLVLIWFIQLVVNSWINIVYFHCRNMTVIRMLWIKNLNKFFAWCVRIPQSHSSTTNFTWTTEDLVN